MTPRACAGARRPGLAQERARPATGDRRGGVHGGDCRFPYPMGLYLFLRAAHGWRVPGGIGDEALPGPPMRRCGTTGTTRWCCAVRAATQPVNASVAEHDCERHRRPRRARDQHDGQPREHRPGRERHAHRDCVLERGDPRGAGDAVLRLGMRGQPVVGGQLGGDRPGEAGGKAGEWSSSVSRRSSRPARWRAALARRRAGPPAGRLGPELGVLDGAHGQRPGHQPGEPGEEQHAELTPAPANPSQIPADVRMPSLASGMCGRTHPKTLLATLSPTRPPTLPMTGICSPFGYDPDAWSSPSVYPDRA